MKYVKTMWSQSAPDEPVCFYEETAGGKVRRFIEEFADGTFGCADADMVLGGTWLPEETCSADDVAGTPEYKCSPISAEEFEEVWRRARANVRGSGDE